VALRLLGNTAHVNGVFPHRGGMADPHGRRARGSRDEHGFTLTELLIVIVILGVLASVTVYAVGGLTTQAAVTACRADFETVETAQVAYLAQTGTKAAEISELQTPTIGLDGGQVGPWLKDALANTNLYVISVDDGTVVGGKTGAITVASVNPPRPAQDGPGNCAYV
jgi:prepilin-type N-terminal cleavage/methylation domain-containing protein